MGYNTTQIMGMKNQAPYCIVKGQPVNGATQMETLILIRIFPEKIKTVKRNHGETLNSSPEFIPKAENPDFGSP